MSLAQTKPVTYPEIFAKLNLDVPNEEFKTKEEVIIFLMNELKKRGVDKPLTDSRIEDLKQAGATDELIQVIRQSFPPPTPTPTPTPVEITSTSPFTLQEIINELGKNNTPEAQQILIKKIEIRKYSESISTNTENFFKSAGAIPQLIEALKKFNISNTQTSQTTTPAVTATSTQTPKPTTKLIAFTIVEIKKELQKINSPEQQTELVQAVIVRKVSGKLTKNIEEFLKIDGATPELIEAIKKNLVALP